MIRSGSFSALRRTASISSSPYPKPTGKSGGKDQKSSPKQDIDSYNKLAVAVSDTNGQYLEQLAISLIHLMMKVDVSKPKIVEMFLKGETPQNGEQKEEKRDDYKMDDCLRWHLLLKLVDIKRNKNWSTDGRVKLSKIIIEHQPYLAFENPYVGGKDGKHWVQCKGDKMHDSPEGKKNHISSVEGDLTPFRCAAKSANAAVIAMMISCGRNFYDQSHGTCPSSEFCNSTSPEEEMDQQRCSLPQILRWISRKIPAKSPSTHSRSF
jgi:hypothetical protein